MKLLLDYSDGRYSTRPLDDTAAAQLEAAGVDVAHVADAVWEEYLRYCGQDGIWQALWRSISNEQYVRRRERELLPLEDAAREIRRLTDDLAQAKRMWNYFENEYTRHHQERHRAEHVAYTCVYPQAGCDIEALPLPWRESAKEILEAFSVERAAEGLKCQGCCCGHEHLLLDDQAAVRLRTAGFIVENDSEETKGAEHVRTKVLAFLAGEFVRKDNRRCMCVELLYAPLALRDREDFRDEHLRSWNREGSPELFDDLVHVNVLAATILETAKQHINTLPDGFTDELRGGRHRFILRTRQHFGSRKHLSFYMPVSASEDA